jgi:hypothetical protein
MRARGFQVRGSRYMIIVRELFPSGALEVSAMVKDMNLWMTYVERQTYYGYTKNEARKSFIVHLKESKLVQVNG